MIRLYINKKIAINCSLELSEQQSHYLLHVMRLTIGSVIRIFNAHDGEWEATIISHTKKHAVIAIQSHILPFIKSLPALIIGFAPVKNYAANLLVQKLTELGIAEIYPLLTERSVIKSINEEKLTSASIEAAEQCERLDIPIIHSMIKLTTLLQKSFDFIIFCDEKEKQNNIFHSLKPFAIESKNDILILIGPEGGFTDTEREMIKAQNSIGVCLNGNILRSETASIAALAIIKAMVTNNEGSCFKN